MDDELVSRCVAAIADLIFNAGRQTQRQTMTLPIVSFRVEIKPDQVLALEVVFDCAKHRSEIDLVARREGRVGGQEILSASFLCQLAKTTRRSPYREAAV